METFVETAALVAVLSGDDEQAQRLVCSLLPGERRALMQGAHTLGRLADDTNWCVGCNTYLPGPEGVTRIVPGQITKRWCGNCCDSHD